MKILINYTEIKTESNIIPAFGFAIGIDRAKYSHKKMKTFTLILLCFSFELEITKRH